MIIRKSLAKFIMLPLIFGVVYIWSLYIFDYYITGDQIIYSRFYNEAIGLDFFQTWALQQGLLGSAEPGFAFIISLATQYFTKIEFMSLSNGLLGTLLFVAVKDRKAALLIFLFFVSNYYISVLFFSAERFKFAVILAILVLNMRDSSLRNALLLTPALFHFQYLLLIPPIFAGLYQTQLNAFILRLSVRFSLSKILVFCCIGLGAVLIFSRFSAPLVAKFLAYAGRTDLYDLIRVVLMSGFLVAFSRLKIIAILVALYFILVVAVLGAERIIILEVAYIFALFRLTDIYRVGGFLLMGSYFTFKSVQFYGFVFACGHGFLCK